MGQRGPVAWDPAGAAARVASQQHGEMLPPPTTQIIRSEHAATKLLIFIKIKCNLFFSLAPSLSRMA